MITINDIVVACGSMSPETAARVRLMIECYARQGPCEARVREIVREEIVEHELIRRACDGGATGIEHMRATFAKNTGDGASETRYATRCELGRTAREDVASKAGSPSPAPSPEAVEARPMPPCRCGQRPTLQQLGDFRLWAVVCGACNLVYCSRSRTAEEAESRYRGMIVDPACHGCDADISMHETSHSFGDGRIVLCSKCFEDLRSKILRASRAPRPSITVEEMAEKLYRIHHHDPLDLPWTELGSYIRGYWLALARAALDGGGK